MSTHKVCFPGEINHSVQNITVYSYKAFIFWFSDSMILLGSVKRFELERILWVHLSEEQKIFPPQDDNEGKDSKMSTPGSSRAPTPPPRIEIIPNTPEIKPRFMVTKVNETGKPSESKDGAVFTISRSVSKITAIKGVLTLSHLSF